VARIVPVTRPSWFFRLSQTFRVVPSPLGVAASQFPAMSAPHADNAATIHVIAVFMFYVSISAGSSRGVSQWMIPSAIK